MGNALYKDFGYKGLGPGLLAQLYTGNWGYSWVDTKGGDLVDYARRRKDRLEEAPSKELVRAIFMDAVTIVEAAIQDLVTQGTLTRVTYSAPSNRYTQIQLGRDLAWIFDETDYEEAYTFEYCCECLDIPIDRFRFWLSDRICKALSIAREIQEGKRGRRPGSTQRKKGLDNLNDKDSFSNLFLPLE